MIWNIINSYRGNLHGSNSATPAQYSTSGFPWPWPWALKIPGDLGLYITNRLLDIFLKGKLRIFAVCLSWGSRSGWRFRFVGSPVSLCFLPCHNVVVGLCSWLEIPMVRANNLLNLTDVNEFWSHLKYLCQFCVYPDSYTRQKSLATHSGEIADPEITVKLEMRDVLKVHDEQT